LSQIKSKNKKTILLLRAKQAAISKDFPYAHSITQGGAELVVISSEANALRSANDVYGDTVKEG
jgi:hypothetical protein